MKARVLGGPFHGQHLDVWHADLSHWAASYPTEVLECLDPQTVVMPTTHHHRLAEFGIGRDDRGLGILNFYVYQGPWIASAIAGFLYQRLFEGSRPDRDDPFPTGPEVDEVRRHEEHVAGIAETGWYRNSDTTGSEHWLRTRAADYSDVDGYNRDWAPESAEVRTARALNAMTRERQP